MDGGLPRLAADPVLVEGGWFRILLSVAKSIRIEMGVDGDGSSERFGIETESWAKVFIKLGISGDNEALRLIRRVD